jgi:CHAD domain-containing protein
MIAMKTSAPATLTSSFCQAVRQNLSKLRDGERMVREDGDLEGVHLMRTSCRRLRATVKYLGQDLSRELRKLLEIRLREVMRDLGQVRDLDVLRQAVDGMPALTTSDAEPMRESIEQRLSEATAKMQAAIDGESYARLLVDLEKAAQISDDGTLVAWAAPAKVGAALAGVLRLKPADWASTAEETLHDLRKSVKKARYALEAFAPAYGRPVTRTIERLRELQESLGVVQDASAFCDHLQSMRTFSAGQFIATMRARADGELKRLPELWEKSFGPKGMARLGGHLFRRSVKPRLPAGASESRREAV